MLEILYLVMASSGVYDAHTSWVVAAFSTFEEAIDYRDKAFSASQAAIEAYKCSPEGAGSHFVYFDEPTAFDLAHSVRDTDVTYRVEALPFVKGALGPNGLHSLANAFVEAKAACRMANYSGDFADKLRTALNPA